MRKDIFFRDDTPSPGDVERTKQLYELAKNAPSMKTKNDMFYVGDHKVEMIGNADMVYFKVDGKIVKESFCTMSEVVDAILNNTPLSYETPWEERLQEIKKGSLK